MGFNQLLDTTLGSRRFFYTVECSICGFDEIYYIDPKTEKLLGRACENCHCVQCFNFGKK